MEEETIDMHQAAKKLLEWASSGMNLSDGPAKEELLEKTTRLPQTLSEITQLVKRFEIEGTEMRQYTASPVTQMIMNETPIREFEERKE